MNDIHKHIILLFWASSEDTHVVQYSFRGQKRKLIRYKNECDIIGAVSQKEAIDLAIEAEEERQVKDEARRLMLTA